MPNTMRTIETLLIILIFHYDIFSHQEFLAMN